MKILPYDQRYRLGVEHLLVDLPRLYPGAEQWLHHRLDQAQRERGAGIWIAVTQAQVVGVIILTRKTPHKLKISNLFVHSDFRRQGVGRALFQHASRSWSDADEVYITVRQVNLAGVAAVVEVAGLLPHALILDRYGPGQHEHVLRRPPLTR